MWAWCAAGGKGSLSGPFCLLLLMAGVCMLRWLRPNPMSLAISPVWKTGPRAIHTKLLRKAESAPREHSPTLDSDMQRWTSALQCSGFKKCCKEQELQPPGDAGDSHGPEKGQKHDRKLVEEPKRFGISQGT